MTSVIKDQFINWIVNGSKKSKTKEEEFYLEHYFEISMRLLFVIVAILVIVVTFFYLIAFCLGPSVKLESQSFASYIATLLGTVVALAGSIVAINLARQALNLSEVQNRQSIAERPEYEKGLDAAMAYARFKGILILLPIQLRYAQKNNQIDAESILKGIPDQESLKSLTKHLMELSDTTFITIYNSIVWKSGGEEIGDDAQFLFLNRFSALQSSKNVLRGVQLALTMQSEIDEIIRIMSSDLINFNSYEDYAKNTNNGLQKLDEIEFWFLKHVIPYAKSTRAITFPDFEALKTKAKDSLYKFANDHGITIDAITKFNETILFDVTRKNSATVIASMEDSSLFKILGINRNHFHKKTATFSSKTMQLPTVDDLKKFDVIQVIIPNQWDIYFAQLLLLIEEVGQERKAKLLVVLDQISLYQDSINQNSKYLTLSQHLDIWQFFGKLTNLLIVSDRQIGHELSRPGFRSDKVKDAERWNEFRDSEENLNKMRIWRKDLSLNEIIFSKDNLAQVLNAAAVAIKAEFEFDADLMISKLKMIATESMKLDFSEVETKVIKELSKSPLFNRPFYELHYPVGFAYQKIPELMLANMEILACCGFDDELNWPTNIFIEWMMVNPNEAGVTHKDIYWID